MKNRLLFVAFGLVGCSFAAAESLWTPIAPIYPPAPDNYPVVKYLGASAPAQLDRAKMAEILAQAPLEGEPFAKPIVVDLPVPSGGTQKFAVTESPILSPALARKIPIKTYIVQGIDDPYANGRMDFGTYGFHAMVFTPSGDFVIDPIRRKDLDRYLVYARRDTMVPRYEFECWTEATKGSPLQQLGQPETTGPDLKTYRLALNTTIEYTNYYGSVAAAQAGAVTSVNRVTGVYEKECAIRLNLTYLKCFTGSDPFTNNSGGTMLGQNQTECDTTVGNANYDIGHVFSTGGGGVAGLSVVGITGQKARGVTGSGAPIGDNFDIDYVAHEMGHQFAGRHTFNGTTGSCGGGNRDSTAAYEPGSASTIMGYAGICGSEDLQPHSDAYFHTRSIQEMVSKRNNSNSGGTTTSTGNSAPSVNAGPDISIPIGTPFKLTATGSDPDSDPLLYCWEQYDLGTASPTTNNTTRPLFRSFNPTSNPTRFFPRLNDLLSNAATPWEILPTVSRTMTFRCTVRDNRAGGGGVEVDTMVVNVTGAALQVTSPNTSATVFTGSTQTVTWNVGGSAALSPNVNILLSTDGGNSYATGGTIVLASNVPNDGSQDVVVPNIQTNSGRVFVESTDGRFFDVSNSNFPILNAVVSGTVTLGHYSGTVAFTPITMEVVSLDGNTVYQSVSVLLNASGGYTFNAAIPSAGSYLLRAKGSHWLRKAKTPVTMGSGASLNNNFTLINGDVDGDNEVGPSDFSALSAAFGSALGDPDYSAIADLDGDGEIGPSDFSILSSNFGQTGD